MQRVDKVRLGYGRRFDASEFGYLLDQVSLNCPLLAPSHQAQLIAGIYMYSLIATGLVTTCIGYYMYMYM